MATLKDLAQEAIDVQNTCNLSGVVHSFSRAISNLREILEKDGQFSTDKLNRHPICQLYASKIASLSNMTNDANFSAAYRAVLEMAN